MSPVLKPDVQCDDSADDGGVYWFQFNSPTPKFPNGSYLVIIMLKSYCRLLQIKP